MKREGYPDLTVIGDAKLDPYGWEAVYMLNNNGDEVRLGSIQRVDKGHDLGRTYPHFKVKDKNGKQISITNEYDTALSILEQTRRVIKEYSGTWEQEIAHG